MRAATSAAIAKALAQYGSEPVNVIEIHWQTGAYIYSDRVIDGVGGKILELANLENVVDISASSNTQSLSIKLDDTDGSIKNIYNYNDIHKRPVKVYQWYEGISLSDRFLIFEGEISSPIVWDEGDRTVSFEVISKVEDAEVGFAPDEGDFDEIPDELIGRMWPLPFGLCGKIPCLQLDPIPSAVTTGGIGFKDPSLDKEMARLRDVIQGYIDLALYYFQLALQAYVRAVDISGDLFNPDQQWESIGDQYTDQGNNYLAQAGQAQQDLFEKTLEAARQEQLATNNVGLIDGQYLPQGAQFSAKVRNATVTGSAFGNNMSIDEAEHPLSTINLQRTVNLFDGSPPVEKLGFYWVPGGTNLRITTPMPVRFIVSMIPVNVLGIYANRDFQGTKKLIEVPTNYYTVSYQAFGSVTATIVTLYRPLSTYDEGWEDSLYVDVLSPIGPNTVEILKWIIANYTSLSYDSATFDSVQTKLANFPSHFCLFDQQNIVDVLREIAFQARCAIWLNNGVFYLRYLPEKPSPVDSITVDDILYNSLRIEHTSTESIVTKLKCAYQTDYYDTRKKKVIVRNNTAKYGTQEQEIDWFIYNTPDMVYLASTYWSIKKANTWKILTFTTPMTKIRLETFDPISITLPYSHNGTVIGIIESVKYNSESFTLSFRVWIPVRLGEMDEYPFAYPTDASLVFPSGIDVFGVQTPGQSASGSLKPLNGATRARSKTIRRNRPHRGHPNPGTQNVDAVTAVALQNPVVDTGEETAEYEYNSYSADPFNIQNDERKTLPGKVTASDGQNVTVSVYPYGLSGQTREIEAICPNCSTPIQNNTWVWVTAIVWEEEGELKVENVVIKQSSSSCFPGYVLGKESGDTYSMRVYENGLTQDAVDVNVKQLDILPDETIPNNRWTLVSKVGDSYYMQFPIWLE